MGFSLATAFPLSLLMLGSKDARLMLVPSCRALRPAESAIVAIFQSSVSSDIGRYRVAIPVEWPFPAVLGFAGAFGAAGHRLDRQRDSLESIHTLLVAGTRMGV